jgi:glycosyltransferase involved in cell wall biosynthesis
MLVHTHTAKAGTLGRLAAWLTGVPIRVHTFHGHVFQGYYSSTLAWIFIAIERWLARHTDCIIALSASQKRELCEIYRIAPPEKIRVVPLSVNLAPYLAVKGRSGILRSGMNEAASLVGWVGRLTGIKAPDRLLQCVPAVTQQVPEARFVMVGDGELRPECEQQIQRERLADKVTMLGWRRDLPEIYADLDVLALCSKNEGTPVALLEAMASGKAVVSTDIGGVRDLMVGAGENFDGMKVFANGILVESRSTLAKAICYLLYDPEKRRRMGQAGREFVRHRFSQQHQADELEQLYLLLAREKGLHPAPAIAPIAKHESATLSMHTPA